MNEGIVTGTDVKRYYYCPLMIYYDNVIHIEERKTEAMIEGEEVDKDSIINFLYPSLKPISILKKPYLFSKKYGASGIPDFVLKFSSFWSPLDVKNSPYERRDHKLQVLFYSFLLEENGRNVKEGFLYYPKRKKTVRIIYGEDERKEMIRIIKKIREIANGKIPKVRQPRSKCENCGFFFYCKPSLKGEISYV